MSVAVHPSVCAGGSPPSAMNDPASRPLSAKPALARPGCATAPRLPNLDEARPQRRLAPDRVSFRLADWPSEQPPGAFRSETPDEMQANRSALLLRSHLQPTPCAASGVTQLAGWPAPGDRAWLN